MAEGVVGGCRPCSRTLHSDLCVQIGGMPFHGADTEAEILCDVLITLAPGKKVENLGFGGVSRVAVKPAALSGAAGCWSCRSSRLSEQRHAQV